MNKQYFIEIVAGLAAGNVGIINAAFTSAYPHIAVNIDTEDSVIALAGAMFPKAAIGMTDKAPFAVQLGGSTGTHPTSLGLAFAQAFVNEVQGTAVEKFLAESDKERKKSKDTGQGAAPSRSMGLGRY